MEFFNSLLLTLGKLLLSIGIWVTLALNTFSASMVIKNAAPLPSAQTASSSVPAVSATGTPQTGAPALQKKIPVSPAQSPPAQTAPPAPSVITNDIIAQANTQTRASLVNILCLFRTAHTASYISGSGLIIDPRGVILTNAHVAQFFLLQNYPSPGSTSCVVRTGSPATPAYSAALLYLPPTWIAANASQILSNQAMGTGEHDYAFLFITGPAQFAPALPPSFSALSLSLDNPAAGAPILLAGYPAGFLDANEVQKSLYISSAVSAIQKLYTFDSPKQVDLVSLGGTVVSQGGSSGGAVIDLATDKLTALITTESEGTTTASRDLRALTLSYINRGLQSDGKGSILSFLSGDLLKTSQDFNNTVAPTLTKQLVAAIEK